MTKKKLTAVHTAQTPKPGVFTSEFLVTVLVIVAATVLVALGEIDESVWMLATGLPSTGYAVSRGLAKS